MVMESIRKKFIQDAVGKAKIMEFLEKELENVWIANINIQKSPIETRIYIEMLDPKKLISKKSRRIQHIVDILKNDFHIENPKINIVEVREPRLEPRIVAKRAARNIEKGGKVKQILYRLSKEVMDAGAMGIEIVAEGKLGAKGSKAKKVKVSAGFVPKAGEPARYVGTYRYAAMTQPGIVGITVMIASKDLLKIIKPELAKQMEEKAKTAQEEKAQALEATKQGKEQPAKEGEGNEKETATT